ncbi:MAG: HAMP domain-containing histidine kinase, partial [Propionibacteriaceae bacterium]|nr:HAMP domain-containing histidine kinase [Propionibacteriaceae bacterium]
MTALARLSPFRLWSRSLPFRVVMLTIGASIAILAATGWFLLDQSSRGIIEGKTQASVAEASAVIQSMQDDLNSTDLQTTSVNQRLEGLARDAVNRGQFGNQYFVVVETPVSTIASPGFDPASIPASIRGMVTTGDGLWSTPTLIQFADGRESAPGLVVATSLKAPGQTAFPVFFVFSTAQERQTLAVVQQATLATGLFMLFGLALTVYLISMQVLQPVRAARRAAERLAAGHLEDRMDVVGTEDQASLATSMNHMAEQLARKISELEGLSLVQQRFVSDVSHELRTPLTTIRMAAEVLHANRS